MKSEFIFTKNGQELLSGDIDYLIEAIGEETMAYVITEKIRALPYGTVEGMACITVRYTWECSAENYGYEAEMLGIRLSDDYFYWALHTYDCGFSCEHVISYHDMASYIDDSEPDDSEVDNVAEMYARQYIRENGDGPSGHGVIEFDKTLVLESEIEDLKFINDE